MKWPHPIEAETHISGEFNRCGVEYRNSGRNNFKLNCPFPHPKGNDDGLHLEVTRDGRKAHCWVCDWSGSWNKLAKAMGLAEFGSQESDTYSGRVAESNVFEKLALEFNALSDKKKEWESLPDTRSPWSQASWRGLKLSFLEQIPSYAWTQKTKTEDGRIFPTQRILWPYYQYDRLVGWVGRRLDKKDFQKYYRAEGSDAKKILFPFDYVRTNYSNVAPLVLVEGEVDALNLLQAGIPALAILGSNNWSDYKVDLLQSLNFSHIYVLMDPDQAGRLAEKKIPPDLEDKFEVQVLHLEAPDDPGSLDESQLSWLKNHVFQEKT